MTSQSVQSRRLTESGMGELLSLPPTATPEDIGKQVREAAVDSGCVLVRERSLDQDEFLRLVAAVGDKVEYKLGEGRSDLLMLNASRDKDKVVTGRGPLPLHTDGVLVGTRTDLIILYAVDFKDTPGSGETYVVDQMAAWKEMPESLRSVIEERDFEYRVEEPDFYPTAPAGWYAVPNFRDYGDGHRALNLSTGYQADSEPRSWSVRVPGMTAEESRSFLAELDGFLRSPRYTYQHRWQSGDLLLINNQRTMHGRTPISPDGIRLLWRGQVAEVA
ncbi:TauD/TfdA dioxygenase family protein [Streptomyces flavidovirens]|uniref:TauD/TfdA dioxygenase family protein n=1 Tax=Streptomyces flavidovirens TaxID=67298 RepID=UPI0036750602